MTSKCPYSLCTVQVGAILKVEQEGDCEPSDRQDLSRNIESAAAVDAEVAVCIPACGFLEGNEGNQMDRLTAWAGQRDLVVEISMGRIGDEVKTYVEALSHVLLVVYTSSMPWFKASVTIRDGVYLCGLRGCRMRTVNG